MSTSKPKSCLMEIQNYNIFINLNMNLLLNFRTTKPICFNRPFECLTSHLISTVKLQIRTSMLRSVNDQPLLA